MKISAPTAVGEQILEDLNDLGVMWIWEQKINGGQTLLDLVVPTKNTQKILDLLQQEFVGRFDVKVVVQKIETTLPVYKEEADEVSGEDSRRDQPQKKVFASEVSREELYQDVYNSSKLSHAFVALVLLSTAVAGIGLLKDNMGALIGAMIIAPLIGPNVALALATTLGDAELAVNCIKTSVVGVGLALVLSITGGFFISIDSEFLRVVANTKLDFMDIILAAAAGVAGALAFTSALPSALVGVMIAVALLPPLVAAGLLLGSLQYEEAWRAALLFVTNLICINLAGVITFWVQGVTPLQWYEAKRAKKATYNAVSIWLFLLGVLIVFIVLRLQ